FSPPIQYANPKSTPTVEPAASVEPLSLPSGASLLLGNVATSFSCENLPYGYYADVDNRCFVFHICNPTLFEDGTVKPYHYSFICGEGAVFDQNKMTCVHLSAAIPCGDSPNFYFRSSAFGLPHEKL
ncbi:unnamed protein product, partial [Meganyctiphanes norvegica]